MFSVAGAAALSNDMLPDSRGAAPSSSELRLTGSSGKPGGAPINRQEEAKTQTAATGASRVSENDDFARMLADNSRNSN